MAQALPTSYRFWSSAAFLIHMSFSFFSMLFQVISMAFKAFTRSFYGTNPGYQLWEGFCRWSP